MVSADELLDLGIQTSDALSSGPREGIIHRDIKSVSMVHGETKKHLDIERIAQIKKAAGVFLTLHGGSGTDVEDFRNAIAAGINDTYTNAELRLA
jgi:fructose-bisphosphate aldolase, class II